MRVALEVQGNAWEIARMIEPHVRGAGRRAVGHRQARAKPTGVDARTLARAVGGRVAGRGVDVRQKHVGEAPATGASRRACRRRPRDATRSASAGTRYALEACRQSGTPTRRSARPSASSALQAETACQQTCARQPRRPCRARRPMRDAGTRIIRPSKRHAARQGIGPRPLRLIEHVVARALPQLSDSEPLKECGRTPVISYSSIPKASKAATAPARSAAFVEEQSSSGWPTRRHGGPGRPAPRCCS